MTEDPAGQHDGAVDSSPGSRPGWEQPRRLLLGLSPNSRNKNARRLQICWFQV